MQPAEVLKIALSLGYNAYIGESGVIIKEGFYAGEDEDYWDIAYEKISDIKEDLKSHNLEFVDYEYDNDTVWGKIDTNKG